MASSLMWGTDVGPGALARLIFGALRFDRATFERAASADGFTRLHLAVVLLAAISIAFATATGAVAAGVVGASEPALYRAIVLCWGLAAVLHFVLFVAIAWLLQRVRGAAALTFPALTRLLSLSLAPSCLAVLLALLGFGSGSAAMTFVATQLGPRAFFWVGTLIGYYPDDLTLLVGLWGLVIGVVALRVGANTSWAAAAATVLVAARLVGPLPDLADLVMNGLR
jgi:hypothetical protein